MTTDRIEPLTPKQLDPEERRRLFSIYENEILDSFDPADFRALLEYILFLEAALDERALHGG